MIRLFKHYIPHAVLLLGLLDLALLVVASEMAWQLRAAQIAMDPGPMAERWIPLLGSASVVWLAMISVGVYGVMVACWISVVLYLATSGFLALSVWLALRDRKRAADAP